MLATLNKLLRERSGVISLEAILSIMVLLMVSWGMWGLSVVIYNQTLLNTSTNFAAHSAMTAYERETYRGGDNVKALQAANITANEVFAANMNGRIPDQFKPESDPGAAEEITGFRVACGPLLPGNIDISVDRNYYTEDNCSAASPRGKVNPNATVTLMQINTKANGIIWFLSPFANDRDDRTSSQGILYRSQATTVSVGPVK